MTTFLQPFQLLPQTILKVQNLVEFAKIFAVNAILKASIIFKANKICTEIKIIKFIFSVVGLRWLFGPSCDQITKSKINHQKVFELTQSLSKYLSLISVYIKMVVCTYEIAKLQHLLTDYRENWHVYVLFHSLSNEKGMMTLGQLILSHKMNVCLFIP